MAGRVGVGGGQPYVQGHEAGLEAEAHNGQHENRGGEGGGEGGGRKRIEIRGAGGAVEEAEERHEADRSDVGGDQVNPGGAADGQFIVVRGDEEKRGDGHDFPDDEKENGIAREDDQDHGAREQAVEEAQAAAGGGIAGLLPVFRAINGAERGDHEDGDEEERGESV